MHRGSTTPQDGETGTALPSWRSDTLKAMLSVAAIAGPIAAAAAIVGRPPPRLLLDSIVVGGVGVALPALRLWTGAPFTVRSALTIALFYATGVFVVARGGLVPNATMLFALSSIMGAIYFGHVVAFATVLAGALAFFIVGWLVSHGGIVPTAASNDPLIYLNWLRVGFVDAAIGTLLTSGVAFVIGRVEASARDLRVAYEGLGRLHLRLESAKEEERRFLAHELHDELGQLLTALKLRLHAASRRAGAADDPDALAMIDDMIARVRRMSGDLRPVLLDESGLVPALRAYLDAQAEVAGIVMTLEADEATDAPLARDVEITCFRVVQEAVTNAIRHAAPRALRVRLERSADRVALRVTDDGLGFDVAVRLEDAASTGHLGVVGMRERVRAHGGGFRLSSRPGAGTTIEVELPVTPAPLAGPAAVPS